MGEIQKSYNMLTDYKHHKTVFTCDLHNGSCCSGDTFELEIEDDWFLDDCEGGPYVALSVGYVASNLWYMLKYWWKHRKWHQICLYINIDSLKGLEQRIEELLPVLEERKRISDKKIKVHPVLLTGIDPNEKTFIIFDDSTKKSEHTLAEKLLKDAKDAKK